MHALPNDKNFYSKTKIKLGFNIEPFANIGHDTESITTVKEKKNIVQCSYCKAFYSENFKINIEEDNYVIYKNAYQCGICGNKGTFYSQGNNEQLSNEIPNNIKKEEMKFNRRFQKFIIERWKQSQNLDFHYFVTSVPKAVKTIFFSFLSTD